MTTCAVRECWFQLGSSGLASSFARQGPSELCLSFAGFAGERNLKRRNHARLIKMLQR